MNILGRVDADDVIGSGHLVRTVALLEALVQRQSAECVLATRSRQLASPFPVVYIPTDIPPESEGDFLRAAHHSADLFFADLYRPSQAQVDGLCRGDWKTLFVDDENDLMFSCDVLVHPNISRRFHHRHTSRTRYMAGPEVLILREQFAGLSVHPARESIRRILVSFGGGNQNHLLSKIVPWLKEFLTRDDVCISIVVGASVETGDLISLLPGDSRWQVFGGVSDMAALMHEADIGVLSGGTLLYEAAAAGLPSIVISLNASQKRESQEADRLGVVIHLGDQAQISQQLLTKALESCTPSAIRSRMINHGQSMIDGKGVERILHNIMELLPAAQRA